MKREDLNHTVAHKINNVIGQSLLAKKMGKTRLIAETAATIATGKLGIFHGMKSYFCQDKYGRDAVPHVAEYVKSMKDALRSL